MDPAQGQPTVGSASQPVWSIFDARRIAKNGEAYTWQEYREYYGDHALQHWEEAIDPAVANESGGGYKASQRAANENTPDADAHQHQQNHGDASQLASDPAVADGAEMPTEQILALQSVCTFEEMQQVEVVKNMGGKAACQKQRELRQECLESGVYEIDVTHTWPEWRPVLRALPTNLQQMIIGNGIAQVKFRLLEGKLDPNYFRKNDSGERHVFEIKRVDGSYVHLHYHKNGKLDDPVVHGTIDLPQNASSGASQPTAPSDEPSPSEPIIGRKEAVMALSILLNNCWRNENSGAVDITDGHAFDWRRFIDNSMEQRQIDAMDIERVFALKSSEDFESHKIAFCTRGTSWTLMDPTQKNYKNTRHPALEEMDGDWRAERVFVHAKTVDKNWMRV